MDVDLEDLMEVSKHSQASLSGMVCDLIREDRGFSLIDSDSSNGIPSPVRESETFKELVDFKSETGNSSRLLSKNIKKIKFSGEKQSTPPWKKAKKKEVDKEESEEDAGDFSHSHLDQFIFNDRSSGSHFIKPEDVKTDQSFSTVMNLTEQQILANIELSPRTIAREEGEP